MQNLRKMKNRFGILEFGNLGTWRRLPSHKELANGIFNFAFATFATCNPKTSFPDFGWLSLLDYIDFFLESLTLLLKKLSLWLTSPNLGRLTSGNYFPLVLQNQRWYKQQNKRYTLQQNHLKKNKFFFGHLRFFLYLCIRKRLIRQETALCKKMQIRLEENVHWHIEKSPYLCRRQTELIT